MRIIGLRRGVAQDAWGSQAHNNSPAMLAVGLPPEHLARLYSLGPCDPAHPATCCLYTHRITEQRVPRAVQWPVLLTA